MADRDAGDPADRGAAAAVEAVERPLRATHLTSASQVERRLGAELGVETTVECV